MKTVSRGLAISLVWASKCLLAALCVFVSFSIFRTYLKLLRQSALTTHHGDDQPEVTGVPSASKIKATVVKPMDFRPLRDANVTWWFDDDKKNNSCHIGSDWKFLGHGGAHYVFSTLFVCRDQIDETRILHQREITIRMLTHRWNAESENNDTRPDTRPVQLKNFTSATTKSLEDARKFGVQLRSGTGAWTGREIDKRFCIDKGVAYIPTWFLKDLIENSSADLVSKHSFVGVEAHDGTDMVVAKLAEYAPGGSHLRTEVGKPRRLTDSQHLKVLKDLVEIYRYMFERGLVHCDMSMDHAIVTRDEYDVVQIQLVDFERIMINLKNGKPAQSGNIAVSQVWQLMGIMARSCAPNIRENRYEVHSAVCRLKTLGWTDPVSYEKSILPELWNCPFVRPLNWTRTMLSDAKFAYERLSDLVGLEN